MKTIVRNPFAPVLFDTFFGKDWSGVLDANILHNASVPAVNIAESEESFKIELAAPGLKKDDFKLNLEKNVLSISVKKEVANEENTDKYTRKEFSYSSFKRSFTLPETVNTDEILANYEDGVLKVALPKKEEAKAKEPRLIEVA